MCLDIMSLYCYSRERRERSRERLDTSTLYDVYTNKSCRCPAVFVRDSLGVTTAGPLYEYTYACTSNTDTVNGAVVDTVVDAKNLEPCIMSALHEHCQRRQNGQDFDVYSYEVGSRKSRVTKSNDPAVLLCDLERLCVTDGRIAEEQSDGREIGGEVDGYVVEHRGVEALSTTTNVCRTDAGGAKPPPTYTESCTCGRPRALSNSSQGLCGGLPNVVYGYNQRYELCQAAVDRPMQTA